MAARREKCHCSFDKTASPQPVVFLSPEKLYFLSCDAVLLRVQYTDDKPTKAQFTGEMGLTY
jgi:hypothetical protein